MKHLLAQGLGDAVGFVVGALLGFFAGQLLGCDVFEVGYSARSMVGLQAARRWLHVKPSEADAP